MSGSNRERKRMMREYHHLYTRHEYEGRDSICFYCGEPKQEMDHVPPLVLVDYATPARLRRLKVKFVLVPSCKDCNSRIGAKKLGTVEERLAYLYGALTTKLEKDLTLWPESDIKEMSAMFQRMIRARKAQQAVLIERIRGIEDRLCKPETYP